MVNKPALDQVIWRNLTELTYAEDFLNVLFEWGRLRINYKNHTNTSFFTLADIALRDETMSKLMKVLDTNKQSYTFWYIYGHYKDEIDLALEQYSLSHKIIESFYKDRLKCIRDQTHMHLDAQGIMNTPEIYSNADIKWDEFRHMIKSLRAILQTIWNNYYNNNRHHARYGGDLITILEAAESAGVLTIKERQNNIH